MMSAENDAPGNVTLPRYAFDQLIRDQREMARSMADVAAQGKELADALSALRILGDRQHEMALKLERLESTFNRHDADCRENRSLQKADRPAWTRMWVGIISSFILGLMGLLAGLSRNAPHTGH